MTQAEFETDSIDWDHAPPKPVIHWLPRPHQPPASRTVPAAALGGLALGVVAIGALALAALAISRMPPGQIGARRLNLGRLAHLKR